MLKLRFSQGWDGLRQNVLRHVVEHSFCLHFQDFWCSGSLDRTRTRISSRQWQLTMFDDDKATFLLSMLQFEVYICGGKMASRFLHIPSPTSSSFFNLRPRTNIISNLQWLPLLQLFHFKLSLPALLLRQQQQHASAFHGTRTATFQNMLAEPITATIPASQQQSFLQSSLVSQHLPISARRSTTEGWNFAGRFSWVLFGSLPVFASVSWELNTKRSRL